MSIFIESSLMSKIRFLVYQFPFVKNPGDRARLKKYFSDMNFICLSAFLDFKKHDMFLKLFPQYKQEFQRYTTIVNKVTAVILNRGSSKNPKIDKLGKALGRHVYFSFKPQRGGRYEAKKMRVERSIVRDIIINPRYVNTYYEILFT